MDQKLIDVLTQTSKDLNAALSEVEDPELRFRLHNLARKRAIINQQMGNIAVLDQVQKLVDEALSYGSDW